MQLEEKEIEEEEGRMQGEFDLVAGLDFVN